MIEKYNPEWPDLFQAEKKLILDSISENIVIKISHIGSTAIPGIMAKPTIDILLEVSEEIDKEAFISSFIRIGYHYILRPENPPPHIMLAKGYSVDGYMGQAFHVHVRYSDDWDEILFRDSLIVKHEIAKEYEVLKLELAKKFKYNREAYTAGKTEFINKILKLIKLQ